MKWITSRYAYVWHHQFFFGYRGFCHRNESDSFFFLFICPYDTFKHLARIRITGYCYFSQHWSNNFIYFSLLGCFTMDVIASTSFGVDINSQRDSNNEFVKNAKIVMRSAETTSPLLLIGSKKVFISCDQIVSSTKCASKIEKVLKDNRKAWSEKITSSEKRLVSTSRTYASPKWDEIRCPEE